jgi:hypothetical protein
MVVAEVAKTFGIVAPPKLLMSSATTVSSGSRRDFRNCSVAETLGEFRYAVSVSLRSKCFATTAIERRMLTPTVAKIPMLLSARLRPRKGVGRWGRGGYSAHAAACGRDCFDNLHLLIESLSEHVARRGSPDPAETGDRRSPLPLETFGRAGGSVGRPATARRGFRNGSELFPCRAGVCFGPHARVRGPRS